MKKLIAAIIRHRKEDLMGLRPWRKHSQVLTMAGGVYTCYGLSLLAVDFSSSRLSGLTLALKWMSIHNWGYVWLVVGLLALLSSRWPPASETWGYSALSALAALWGAFYGLSMLFLDAPPSGISGTLVWSLVAYMWWTVGGLRNPEDVITLPLGEVVQLLPPSQSDTDEEP